METLSHAAAVAAFLASSAVLGDPGPGSRSSA